MQAAAAALLAGIHGHKLGPETPCSPEAPCLTCNSHIPHFQEHEDEITRALLVGNYSAAADAALAAGRMADALLVANLGGADLFKRTMQRYMRRNPRPYMQVGGRQGAACVGR